MLGCIISRGGKGLPCNAETHITVQVLAYSDHTGHRGVVRLDNYKDVTSKEAWDYSSWVRCENLTPPPPTPQCPRAPGRQAGGTGQGAPGNGRHGEGRGGACLPTGLLTSTNRCTHLLGLQIRVYSIFLDERLDLFRLLKFDIQVDKAAAAERVREMSSGKLLDCLPRMQKAQRLLTGCVPEGSARDNGVVMVRHGGPALATPPPSHRPG